MHSLAYLLVISASYEFVLENLHNFLVNLVSLISRLVYIATPACYGIDRCTKSYAYNINQINSPFYRQIFINDVIAANHHRLRNIHTCTVELRLAGALCL